MTLPTFTQFYEAVHDGRSPFPWQVRLTDEVLERGWSGLLLDLPTGTGKTSALDVALYCLARAPDRMPRRTLLVVDRRIVVDQGADHARNLQRTLDKATSGPALLVANALRELIDESTREAEASCFGVAVMRGGMPRDNDWARRPDMAVLGVSTVDQVGSRLLFRGYGVNPLSASIHAGLLGNDTLILLDEVHLAVPFAQTLEVVRSRYRRSVPGLPDRFAVVTMSATARTATSATRVFGLDASDQQDPTLDRRLSASKHAQLVAVKVTGDEEAAKREALARRAVSEAIKLQEAKARVVAIVVNRVDTARLALRLLRTHHAEATSSLLVTGRMRPIDRDRVVRGELARATAGRPRSDHDGPLVVVATQCIEAGADLDFDGLVTECASLDALRQRFGRVDRRGELRETRSIILGRSDQVTSGAVDPIYGQALAATWAWLSSQAANGSVDFGVRALPAAVDADGHPLAQVLAQVRDAPVMLPAHLDAWAQTSILPTPDPDVALWLHGPERPTADVQVVWRALPDLGGLTGLALGDVDDRDPRLVAVVEQLLAVRPSTLESITVPIGAAKRWLAGDTSSSIADVVAGDADASEEAPWRRRTMDKEKEIVALRWAGDDSELVSAAKIKPGDVLIVDVSRGGLRDDSFDPESTAAVSDVGDLAQLRGRGQSTMRLSRMTLPLWHLPDDVNAMLPVLAGEESLGEFASRSREWLETWPLDPPVGFVGTGTEWRATRATLTKRARAVLVGKTLLLTAPVNKKLLSSELSELITEDDDSSFRAVEVTLSRHSHDVKMLAEQYARALGFGTSLVSQLGLAAWLHDVGKADPRFQRWLVGGDEIRAVSTSELLAKSALPPGNAAMRRRARVRAGYPDGYRHELLSMAMIAGNDDALRGVQDPDLVLHLVASHHGWCRPFPPPVDDPVDILVEMKHGDASLAATTRHQLSRLDSGVVDRYQSVTERYGWWGLAWLEAVLRLADHRASEQEAAG
jgi:CRISPR-associated endonuclease/helicase Cas3